jgi:hypothetical protein
VSRALRVAVCVLAAAGLVLVLARADEGEGRTRAANHPFRAALISTCVRAKDPARVRALALDGARLPFDVAAGHEPGSRPRCRDDELRLLRLQSLRIAGERTYVRRGGCALPCVVRQATVHVPASAFARPVGLLPRSARNKRGAANGVVMFTYARARSPARATGPADALHGWVLAGYRYMDRAFVPALDAAATPRRRPAVPSGGA